MTTATAVQTVKRMVSAREAALALGLSPDRHGRCACPFHGGKDNNLKLFDGDRGYYCFVCHATGDAVNLVSTVRGCTAHEGVSWLNDAFGLGLPINDRMDAEREKAARKAIADRRRKREEAEREFADTLETQHRALELTMRMEGLLEKHQPKTYSEDFSDDFADLLMWLEDMRIWNDDLAVMVSAANEERNK